MKAQWVLGSTACLLFAASASAGPITTPFVETFDGPTTPVTLGFNDFGDAVNPADVGANGTNPGVNLANGQAVIFDNTNFGDVATALVQPSFPAATPFTVSADFDVADTSGDNFDFTNSRIGVLANGIDPTNFNQTFSGLYAYVENINVSGDQYVFVLANDDTILGTSAAFDLTDGTPDFSIQLDGVFQPGGDLDLTATFTDAGGENAVAPLLATVAGVDIPGGSNAGVRAAIGFNNFEVGVDTLTVALIPEPGSLALLGVAGAAVLVRRRA
ncbi:MAG: PEP-CTERM sorting domain-containing protein [Planctomycetota bacterium]